MQGPRPILKLSYGQVAMFRFFWKKTIKGGTCINQDQFYRWNGVANLLIDFMVLTPTLPLIWRLKLKSRQKLSVSGGFSVGNFVS